MAIKEERPSAALAVAAHAPVASAAASSRPAGAAAPPAAEVQDAIEAQPTIPLHSWSTKARHSTLPLGRRVCYRGPIHGGARVHARPPVAGHRTHVGERHRHRAQVHIPHHARIVREGNQYYAVDLESANGVRVNGVDHDRVLLSPGDQIELGRSTALLTEEGGGELEPGLVVWARARSSDRGRRRGGVALVWPSCFQVAGHGRGRSACAAIVAQPLPPPPPPPRLRRRRPWRICWPPGRRRRQARSGRGSGRSQQSRRRRARFERGGRIAQLAEDEKGQCRALCRLEEAAEKSNFEAVLRGAGEIPETSVYKERASVLEKSARAEYVKLHVDAASSKASVGACDEARARPSGVGGGPQQQDGALDCRSLRVLAKKASPKPR